MVKTIAEICADCGIARRTYFYRKKKGIPLDAPNLLRNYGDITRLCAENGISRDTYKRRMKTNLPLDAPARRTPPQPNSYRSRCKAIGLKLQTFYQRRRKGMTAEEALAKGAPSK